MGPLGQGRVGAIFAFSIFAFSAPGDWMTNYRIRVALASFDVG